MLKKTVAVLFIITILFSVCTGCGKKSQDKRVNEAIEVICNHWSKYYAQQQWDGKKADKYLQIANTTIINIKDEFESEEFPEQTKWFENVDYIVEFELISNYFNTSPYYSNAYTNNCVVVYKDGTKEVKNNLFNIYRATTYSYDYSHIIESVETFDGEYDKVLEIK